MNLEVMRRIDHQEVTYRYSIDKRNPESASKFVDTDLSKGCLYEFEDKWSRCWDPILPYSEQIDPIKLEVLSYEPDQSCPFQTEPCLDRLRATPENSIKRLTPFLSQKRPLCRRGKRDQ